MPVRHKNGRSIVTVSPQRAEEGRRPEGLPMADVVARSGAMRLWRGYIRAAKAYAAAKHAESANRCEATTRARKSARDKLKRRQGKIAARVGRESAARMHAALLGDGATVLSMLSTAGVDYAGFLEAALVRMCEVIVEKELDAPGALEAVASYAVDLANSRAHKALGQRTGQPQWFKLGADEEQAAKHALMLADEEQRKANAARNEREQRERWAASAAATTAAPDDHRKALCGGDADEPDQDDQDDQAAASHDDAPSAAQAAASDTEADPVPIARPGPIMEQQPPSPAAPASAAPPPGGFVDAQGNAYDAFGQLVASRSAVDPDFAERAINAGNARGAKLIEEFQRHEAARRAQQPQNDPPSSPYINKPRSIEEAIAQSVASLRPPLVRP